MFLHMRFAAIGRGNYFVLPGMLSVIFLFLNQHQQNSFMYKKHKQYRLFNFDYSQDGYYFITIVTKDREHFFGEIVNQQMIYTPIGEFAKINILKFYADENLDNPYQNNPFL